MWSSTRSEWKNLRPHPNHFVPCVCVSNICNPDIVISSQALVGHQDEVGWETQERKKDKPLPKSPTKSQSKKKSTRNLSQFELLPQKPLTLKIDQSLLGSLGASTSDLSSVLAHQLPSQGEANSPVISGEKVPVAKNRTVTIATATKWKTENDKKLDTSMWLQFEVDGSSVSALKCSACAKFEDKLRGCKNFTQAFIIGSRNVRSSAFKGHADSDMHKQAMHFLRQSKSTHISEYAQIARSFTTLDPMIEAQKKFDLAYFLAKKPLPFKNLSQWLNWKKDMTLILVLVTGTKKLQQSLSLTLPRHTAKNLKEPWLQ